MSFMEFEPQTMSEVSSPPRQSYVLLDVGAKMVQEFPHLVEKWERLFIDRNPKGFPWIQEIYRDGDIQGSMPKWTQDQLQKELDFYQLPLEQDVHLYRSLKGTFSKEAYADAFMEQILTEIRECELDDFFPWTILVYHKILRGVLQKKRSIYISPPMPVKDAEFIKTRGHFEFDQGLQMEGELCPRMTLGDRTKLSPFKQDVEFLIWKKGYAFIELLQKSAEKFGMEISEANNATFYLSNGKMVYGHFIVNYRRI